MREIKLTQGFVTIVDDGDFEELSKHKWYYNQGYAVRSIALDGGEQEKVLMHAVIMGKNGGLEVDHITGDRLDNRRENLRHVTKRQNQQNQMSPRGTSIYKGVYWNKATSKWAPQIRIGGKRYYLGRYGSERDAAWIYNVWAESFFGVYARLNVL